MILAELSDKIFGSGPDRVVINGEGEALPWLRAREQHNILPDVIFIRKDGWTLGAPKEFEKTAFDLWADEWIYYSQRPSLELMPIERHPLYKHNGKPIAGHPTQ